MGAVTALPDVPVDANADRRNRLQAKLQRTVGSGPLDSQRYLNAVRDRTALEPLVEGLAKTDRRRHELLGPRSMGGLDDA
jgi:hypothetical protein